MGREFGGGKRGRHRDQTRLRCGAIPSTRRCATRHCRCDQARSVRNAAPDRKAGDLRAINHRTATQRHHQFGAAFAQQPGQRQHILNRAMRAHRGGLRDQPRAKRFAYTCGNAAFDQRTRGNQRNAPSGANLARQCFRD